MTEKRNIVFYDGECGLCHNWVKFILPKDKNAVFHFSPIQGETIKELIGEEKRASLPDSIVVHTENGELLTKTAAVVYILKGVDGIWGSLGGMVDIFPEVISNFVYDFVASIRKKIFPTPKDLCPLMPEELQGQFLQ